jgi:hypothetical protein
MNADEIALKLKEQEVEEKERTTFSREMLELICSQFALSILKHDNLKLEPTDFKFLLEEHMTNASFMESGNPVIIHINMKEMADALLKKGKHLYDFKRLIESCLRTVPKLRHSLAVIPARDYAKWNEELKKFKWHAGSDTDFLPRLLPDSEIHYDVQLRIIATHIKTDTRIIVNDRKMDLIKLKRLARETLSEEVINGTKEKEESKSIEIQDRADSDIWVERQNYS